MEHSDSVQKQQIQHNGHTQSPCAHTEYFSLVIFSIRRYFALSENAHKGLPFNVIHFYIRFLKSRYVHYMYLDYKREIIIYITTEVWDGIFFQSLFNL